MKKLLILLPLSIFLLSPANSCFAMADAKNTNSFSSNQEAEAYFKEIYKTFLKHLYYTLPQHPLTKLAQSIALREKKVEIKSLIPLSALSIMAAEFIQNPGFNPQKNFKSYTPDEYFNFYKPYPSAYFAQDLKSFNKKIDKRYKFLASLCADHGISPERVELITFSALLLELETVISSANAAILKGNLDGNCCLELTKATCSYFMKEYGNHYKTMPLPPVDFMKSLGLSDFDIKELQN